MTNWLKTFLPRKYAVIDGRQVTEPIINRSDTTFTVTGNSNWGSTSKYNVHLQGPNSYYQYKTLSEPQDDPSAGGARQEQITVTGNEPERLNRYRGYIKSLAPEDYKYWWQQIFSKADGGKVEKADNGTKTPTALSGRSYWDGFKARNEALLDKVKNNTFVNMVFPVEEVSKGNTEALLPLVVPGGNAATNAAKLILRGTEKGSSIPKSITKQAIKEAKNLPISEKIFGRQAAAGRTRPNSPSWDIDLLNNYDNGVGIYRTYYMPQRNTRYTPTEIYDDLFGPLPFKHGGRLMRQGGKIIEVPFEK